MVSQCTKRVVSRFTRYEAMNGGSKCRKWGGLGWLRGHSRSWAMPPFDRAHTTSYKTLIETMCPSCTVFEIQPVICQKSPILTQPNLHSAPSQWVTPVEFSGDLWLQKTRFPGLSCGVVCMILHVCLAVLVELRLVTDRRTDGHRAMHSTADAQHSVSKKQSFFDTLFIFTRFLKNYCRYRHN